MESVFEIIAEEPGTVPLRDRRGILLAKTHRDFPTGRKCSRWKAKFLEAVGKAAVDLGDIGHEDIPQAVKRQRQVARSKPDNTLASEATSKRA